MSERKRWDLLWRGVVFIASTFGVYSLVVFLGLIAGPSEGDVLLLAVVPLVAGLVSAIAPMEPRTRILMLGVSSGLLAIPAVLTITYGIGLGLLVVVAAYVLATWMLNEARGDQSSSDATDQVEGVIQVDRDVDRLPLWRLATLMVSIAGIAGVAVVWNMLNDAGPGYLALCAIPLLIGLVPAIVKMETQNRILLLWAAAALSGLVGALTIFSGTGLILLAVMLVYLLIAWMLNQTELRTAR
jgi:phage shock protein PspC (stress-responsive transcriptional regulator)